MKWSRSSRNRSEGSFHVTLPFLRHCRSTSRIWVASTTPARSTLPSAATSASVPRIGPDVITGEAIRTRRSAAATLWAISIASFSPRFGENQARTGTPPTSTASVSTRPLFSTSRFSQSCSKSSANRAATAAESTVMMTFSSRDQESSVQLVEPLHTDEPSRTTYLWCIRSGRPGTPAVGNGSEWIRSGSVLGGGGTGTRRSSWSRL